MTGRVHGIFACDQMQSSTCDREAVVEIETGGAQSAWQTVMREVTLAFVASLDLT